MSEKPPGPVRARRIFETSLYGPDLDELEAFYRRVIGLERIARFGGRGVALRCGDEVLLLFDPDQSAEADGPVPPHGARGVHGDAREAARVADAPGGLWCEHRD